MVSVIIPTYNRERTVMRAIDSVLNQTYTDFEIIVVDDKSTDNTLTLLDGVEDRRFRYVSLEKNSGACVARNRGIEEAKGEYITFLDSDDAYRADFIEQQLKDINENKADVVYCAMQRIYENTDRIDKIPLKLHKGFVKYNDFLKGAAISTQLIFGRGDVFRDICFDPFMPRRQDWDLILRVSKKYTVFYTDKLLVDVYLQSDSITCNPMKGIKALQLIYDKHKKKLHQMMMCFIILII